MTEKPEIPMGTSCGSTGFIYEAPTRDNGPPRAGACPECGSENTWQSGAPVEKLCNNCHYVWDKIGGAIMYTTGALVKVSDRDEIEKEQK